MAIGDHRYVLWAFLKRFSDCLFHLANYSKTFLVFLVSQVNPDAAESEEAAELLSEDGAPYCFAETGEVLKCPVTADRTNRAGIFELKEWARIDRPYCESDFFRELNLDNASMSVAECRETMLERINKCQHGVCPQCVSPCNYAVAKTVGGLMKCMNVITHFGFIHASYVTDAGQLARSLHGAVRKDNYIAVRAYS